MRTSPGREVENRGNQKLAGTEGNAHSPWGQCAFVSECDAGKTGEQIPCASEHHGTRQETARGKDAKAEDDLPEPGQHLESGRSEAWEGDGQQRTSDGRWKKLFDGHMDHFVGHAGVFAMRAGVCLHADQRG